MSRTSRHYLDVQGLYDAIEQKRQDTSWRQLAAELGVDKQVFFRLRAGQGVDVDALVSIGMWLQRPLEDFVRDSGTGRRS